MKSVKKIAIMAAFALALALTYSCSSNEEGDSENTCTKDLLGCPYGNVQHSSNSNSVLRSSSSSSILLSGSSSSILLNRSSSSILLNRSSSSIGGRSSSNGSLFNNIGDISFSNDSGDLMENASYQTGALPAPNWERGETFSVEMNNYIISGGSIILTVTSSRQLSRLYVQFAGSSGYYIVNILEIYLVSYTSGIYIYNVPLQLSQSLFQTGREGQSGLTQMTFSGLEGSRNYSPQVPRSVETVRVGTGSLQISLSWNTVVDLDLWVTPPWGTSIYFGHKTERNGTMDLDANVGCPGSRDIRNENIFFTGTLADGDYKIEVNPYSNCVSTPTAYQVLAYIDGEPYEFSDTQNGQFAARTTGTKKLIGYIRIQDGEPVPYVPISSSAAVPSSSSRPSSSSNSLSSSSSISGNCSVVANVLSEQCTGEFYCSNVTATCYCRVCTSSSSAGAASSSSRGSGVNYGGETYETVVIGDQTWLKRNLNYNATGSVCYENKSANCEIYGRLYDWSTAMALPECNTKSCDSQIEDKHRGICPQGWHIPSDDEWEELADFVDGSSRPLKARTWSGTDAFGFAALPGGGCSGSTCTLIGIGGSWWSATESNILTAHSRVMSSLNDEIINPNYTKNILYSVRCLKD